MTIRVIGQQCGTNLNYCPQNHDHFGIKDNHHAQLHGVTASKKIGNWGLTSVCSFVDLEIFRASKHFSASGKRARKGLFPGVHSNVVDQLVFRLERFAFSRTILPKARVIRDFGAAHVFHGDVGDNVVHGPEHLVAGLSRGHGHVGIDPPTNDFFGSVA